MGLLFEIDYVWSTLFRLIPYVPVTLGILLVCVIASLILGALLALVRLRPIPVLTRICVVLVSFSLGIPLLTMLYMFYFGLPELFLPLGIDLTRTNGLYFVVLAFGLHYGAVLSEHIRGAVGSVDKGQFEAAFSIGLPFFTSLKRIIMPQAMRMLVPNMANTYLKALKSTSIAFSVGVADLLSQAQTIGNGTGHMFESYLAVTILYYALYIALSHLFSTLEKRVTAYDI
jgi:L-cystine transport system permease protein